MIPATGPCGLWGGILLAWEGVPVGAWGDLPTWAIVAIALLGLVQLSLQAFALIIALRTPSSRLLTGRRWVWIVVLALGLVGAIVFLAAARKPACEPDPVHTGHDVLTSTNRVRAAVGYLPDVPGFYPWMTGAELLRFTGRLFGLSGHTLRARVDALLDLAGLSGVKARVGAYSRGMAQRLEVAQALINAPSVLLLDEPTRALDPIGRKSVLDMISYLAGRTTVFFSTHILADLERVCDTVAIVHRGRVAAQARIGELKSRYGVQKIAVEAAPSAGPLLAALAQAPWVSAVERPADDRVVFAVSDVERAQREISAAAAAQGVGIRRLEAVEVSLEDVFVDLVGGR